MLVKGDNKDKEKSKYLCDRCNKELTSSERFIIYVENVKLRVKKKKYDFCDRCYKALERGVEKGRCKNG